MTDDDKSFAEMFQETAATTKEQLRPGQKIEADRKSTRLNSSHRFTYLVCRLLLEKKK